MGRFDLIVERLQEERRKILEESRKRRRERSTKGKGSSRRKKKEKMTFDSPELEEIFKGLPEDMRKVISRE